MFLLSLLMACISFIFLIPITTVKLGFEVLDKTTGGTATRNKFQVLKDRLYKNKKTTNIKFNIKEQVKKTIFKGIKFLYQTLLWTFLSSITTTFITSFFVLIIVITLVSGSTWYTQIVNKLETTISTTVSSSTTNNITATGILGKCEEMSNWYKTNIPTYCTKSDGTGSPSKDGHKGYDCNLTGTSVMDDCSGYASACLTYTSLNGKHFQAATSDFSSLDLTGSGWVRYSYADYKAKYGGLKAGCFINSPGHHIELITKDHDGTVGTPICHWGWGDINTNKDFYTEGTFYETTTGCNYTSSGGAGKYTEVYIFEGQ